MAVDLDTVMHIGARDQWLAVLITADSASSDPDAAVVNAAPIAHPIDGRPVVAFVGRPGTKLRNLRRHPRATLVFRAGWDWVGVQGGVELAGPDDAHAGIGADALAGLLRDIFQAAGGQHPDLDAYDRAMAEERRCAVLITPDRVWSNPPTRA